MPYLSRLPAFTGRSPLFAIGPDEPNLSNERLQGLAIPARFLVVFLDGLRLPDFVGGHPGSLGESVAGLACFR